MTKTARITPLSRTQKEAEPVGKEDEDHRSVPFWPSEKVVVTSPGLEDGANVEYVVSDDDGAPNSIVPLLFVYESRPFVRENDAAVVQSLLVRPLSARNEKACLR